MKDEITTPDSLYEAQFQLWFLKRIPAILFSNLPINFSAEFGIDLVELNTRSALAVSSCFKAYADMFVAESNEERRKQLEIVLLSAETVVDTQIKSYLTFLECLMTQMELDEGESNNRESWHKLNAALFEMISKVHKNLCRWYDVRDKVAQGFEWLKLTRSNKITKPR